MLPQLQDAQNSFNIVTMVTQNIDQEQFQKQKYLHKGPNCFDLYNLQKLPRFGV